MRFGFARMWYGYKGCGLFLWGCAVRRLAEASDGKCSGFFGCREVFFSFVIGFSCLVPPAARLTQPGLRKGRRPMILFAPGLSP